MNSELTEPIFLSTKIAVAVVYFCILVFLISLCLYYFAEQRQLAEHRDISLLRSTHHNTGSRFVEKGKGRTQLKSDETHESGSSNSRRRPVSFKIAGFNTSGSEPQSSPFYEGKGHSLEQEIFFPPGETE